MTDEPQRVTSDDIQGLRDDTSRLADSVETLAERQETTETLVKSNSAQLATNERLSTRANWNSIAAAVALAVLALFVLNDWRLDRERRDREAASQLARRTADCEALGDIAEANIAGANRIVINPVAQAAYAEGMREAFNAVKAGKGYSADCAHIGPPPQPGG